jgi:hypothetical protein
MILTRSFDDREAPCGRKLSGESYRKEEETHVTHRVQFSCGCISMRYEYQDGTVFEKVVHHSGKVLVDQILGAE